MQTLTKSSIAALWVFLQPARSHFPLEFLRSSAGDDAVQKVLQSPEDDPYLYFCCTTSSREFTEEIMLNVTVGSVPKFIQGDWIKMAGAKFEMGPRQVGHGFDAFAKLHKFRFTGDGGVAFSARFVESRIYNQSVAAGTIVPTLMMGETVPPFSGLDYVKAFTNIADNTVINAWALGEDSFVTTTDYALYNEFDRRTLTPRGWFPMNDSFGYNMVPVLNHYLPLFSGAHTQYIGGGSSPKDGKTSINWYGTLSPHMLGGIGAEFTVYRQLWGSKQREAISKPLRLDWVPVVHSFGVTSKHAIFLVHPLSLDLGSTMGSPGPSAASAVKWDGSKKSKVLVLSLEGAEAELLPNELPAIQVFEVDPFFSVHHMNTYEEDGKLTTQVICYGKGDFFDPSKGVNFMTVERDPAKRIKRGGDMHFCEVEVDLVKGTAVWKKHDSLAPDGALWGVEMPRYNDQWQGRKNCYFYGIASPMNRTLQNETKFIQGIGKVDLCAGDVPGNILTFAPKLQFQWEPVFVPSGGQAEDDGVLLVVTMDGELERKTSYLLILDARTLTELARAYLPEGFIIPNGLHSRFFPYADFPLPTSRPLNI